MSRGRKKYHNKKLHKIVIDLRLKAFLLIVTMTIYAFVLVFVLVFSDKERAGLPVWLVLSMAILAIGFWLLFQTLQFRDFGVYENGILLPVHKSMDYSLRRFVPFRDISVIDVSSRDRNMVVHYRDRSGREKSVTLWRMDVEKGFDELVQILKERSAVVVI